MVLQLRFGKSTGSKKICVMMKARAPTPATENMSDASCRLPSTCTDLHAGDVTDGHLALGRHLPVQVKVQHLAPRQEVVEAQLHMPGRHISHQTCLWCPRCSKACTHLLYTAKLGSEKMQWP